jgi:hypothetical protein
MDIQNILDNEVKGSFDFFHNYTNLNSGSRGFGLSVDSTKNPHIASIACVGFALSAWIIAQERGYISYQKALDITKKTLHTLCCHASHYRGFFAHFLHMESGERIRKCEYSTIDTSICLNGVITAAAYFQDEEIQQMAQELLERVDWNFIIFERDGKTLFRMAYNPDKNGDYVTGQPGFIHQWDMAAEQKMMYLQAAIHLEPSLALKLYRGFSRDIGYYGGQKIIINPGGSLFAHQFTEAWIDSENYIDPDGVDWFNNTRLVALANRSFCMEHSNVYKTYHANSWGISCGDSPWGYDVSGSAPCLSEPKHNGTVSICGALASLPFIPELTIDMVRYLYHNHPQTWGQYGFFDSYNIDVSPPWYSNSIYGIDKGCSMIMIENHLSRLIWNIYTNSSYIQKALATLGFHKRKGEENERVLCKEWPVLAE